MKPNVLTHKAVTIVSRLTMKSVLLSVTCQSSSTLPKLLLKKRLNLHNCSVIHCPASVVFYFLVGLWGIFFLFFFIFIAEMERRKGKNILHIFSASFYCCHFDPFCCPLLHTFGLPLLYMSYCNCLLLSALHIIAGLSLVVTFFYKQIP